MATLELTSLHCVRKQDVTGTDEPLIKVDGDEIWSGVMRKGDVESFAPNPAAKIAETAEVKLEERNGDKTKQIGSTIVVRADGKNAQPLEFKTSGAHYQLYFRLI